MKTIEAVVIRIVELAQEKNMSFNSIAINAGLPPSTLKNILDGNSKNPGIITIKIICEGLRISIRDFFDSDLFSDLEQEIF